MPPQKEPRFFVNKYYKNLCSNDPRFNQSKTTVIYDEDDYMSIFANNNETVLGEGSVQYLFLHEIAIPEIKKYLGDPKIIIMLRNPIDRAISSYTRAIRDGFEDGSLLQSIEEEKSKILDNWSLGHFHSHQGLYYKPVKNYLENFTNVKILFYDDYCINPEGTIKSIYSFLGVDKTFQPNMNVRYNVSGIPKARLIHNMMIGKSLIRSTIATHLRKVVSEKTIRSLKERIMILNLKNLKYQLSQDEIDTFLEMYDDNIGKLSILLGKDLDHWLEQYKKMSHGHINN